MRANKATRTISRLFRRNSPYLVIDRSLNPENGKIAVCLVDGEFTVKRIKKEKNKLYLMPENKQYKPIELKEENELIIWGVVEYVIKKV